MKINYVEKTQKKITLADIKVGELFRPTNSRDVYLRTDLWGDDEILTNNCNTLWQSFACGYDNEPFENKDEFEERYDYEDLIVCVDMTNGEVYLLYKDITVERLKSEITIEE